MIRKGDIKQGDIWLVQFDPSKGHEYQGIRPALVIQSDVVLKKSNLVTVMPLTSNIENKTDSDILMKKTEHNRLFVDSVIKVFCISSFDYARFVKKIGAITPDIYTKVKQYLTKHFGL